MKRYFLYSFEQFLPTLILVELLEYTKFDLQLGVLRILVTYLYT